MAAKANKNEQIIDLTVGDCALSFCVHRDAYNKYINSVTPNSKVAPSHNFLVATVEPSDKETLLDILKENVGSEVHLSTALLEMYIPDLEIVAKKRSS